MSGVHGGADRRDAGVEVDRSPSADDTASMLGIVIAGIVDDSYEQAARARAQAGGYPAHRHRMHLTLLVGIAVLGMLMTLAVVQAATDRPEVAAEQSALIKRVDRETAVTDGLTAHSDTLAEQVSQLRASRLTTTATGDAMSKSLAVLGTLAGATVAAGPGLVITVDDADPSNLPDGKADPAGRILDIDLQYLVNGLWLAGAEAVAINGQRLTATTAIRAAGVAITVDYRPLARPYVVQAIGDPNTLEARFIESSGGDWMLNLKATHDVRFDVASADYLQLPGDSNAVLRYAEPEPEAAK